MNKQIEILKLAIAILKLNGGAHSAHWNRTGGHGAGCEACKRENERKNIVEKLLDSAGIEIPYCTDIFDKIEEIKNDQV